MTNVAWKYCPHCGEKLEQATPTVEVRPGTAPPNTTIPADFWRRLQTTTEPAGVVINPIYSGGTVTFTMRPPEDPSGGVREPRRPMPGAPSGYV